ncbi:hypothetical protein [Priestia endophytica]|uniref:hypothetical protein n=1 Tax=Priestia endophytica TaxID=135735 RepID=UPI000F528442|nr:hypothetical protein [Priestia endophytica]RPK08323.1 hypothetical protein FH5_04953 [Priestia endophytica]
MKKKRWIFALVIVIAAVGFYSFIKFNPPIEVNTLGMSQSQNSVVVGIGNTGFSKMKILNVSVNNNEKPVEAKVQISNDSTGLIITEDFNSKEAREFGFTDIKGVTIPTKTSFSDREKASTNKNDKLYGISALHNKAIDKVYIKYRYLGISFEETVSVSS